MAFLTRSSNKMNVEVPIMQYTDKFVKIKVIDNVSNNITFSDSKYQVLIDEYHTEYVESDGGTEMTLEDLSYNGFSYEVVKQEDKESTTKAHTIKRKDKVSYKS